ncbi:MAG: caspase family protein [Gemmataceae bacterium]
MFAFKLIRRLRPSVLASFALGLALALAPTAASAQERSLYMVSVGVGNAKGQARLQAVAKDARDMARWAKAQEQKLFAHVQITTLTNNNATRAGILRALQRLRSKTKPGDYVIFFDSSHGGLTNTGEFNLSAYDGSLYWHEIVAALQGVAGNKIVILDACHSGAAAAQRGPLVVFASSRGTELSFDGSADGNSLFTRHLLAGLYGAADYNRDGAVTLQEAATYAAARLTEADRGKAAKDQQHSLWSLPRGVPASLPLARVLARVR